MSAEVFVVQLNVANWLVQSNTADLSHEESLLQPEPGGNCLNWILGHIVGARDLMLVDVLGGEGVLPAEARERYNRGSDPVSAASDAPLRFGELRDAYQANHDRLVKALQAASEETYRSKAPFSPAGRDDETIGSLLASLIVHDAYHPGQTGILRRLIGRSGALG